MMNSLLATLAARDPSLGRTRSYRLEGAPIYSGHGSLTWLTAASAAGAFAISIMNNIVRD